MLGSVHKLIVCATAAVMAIVAAGCAATRSVPALESAVAHTSPPRENSLAGISRSVRLPPVEPTAAPIELLPREAVPPSTYPVTLASAREPLPVPGSLPNKPAGGQALSMSPIAAAAGPEEVPGEPTPWSGSEVREVTMANLLASVAGRNPQVAFATQRYAEAYAQLIAARVLWLPQINAGVGWNNHSGPLQASSGLVENISRDSLTAGLGVQTIGAGSPVVPGLFANFHSADAIFEPRIANRAAAARDAAVTTTINNLMLDTALAYLDLLRAYQLHAITLNTRNHAAELVRMTADFARAGAGTEADADRAATELAYRQNEVVRAQEEIQVASARVVQLLNDDPYIFLRPLEPTIAPVELVPLNLPLQTLLPTGLNNRPELSEARHLVGAAMHRYRLERTSPWLPNVLMGTSYAGFGGGQGSQIENFAGRFDLDAIAYWQVRGLGVGEYAARREAQARYDQTRFEQVRVMNEVAREIVQAHAQVQARNRQIAIAQQAVERAVSSFERNLSRVRDLQGLPIETLQSIQALDQARREYLRTLVDYNAAQFQLQRALGWPAPFAEATTAPMNTPAAE